MPRLAKDIQRIDLLLHICFSQQLLLFLSFWLLQDLSDEEKKAKFLTAQKDGILTESLQVPLLLLLLLYPPSLMLTRL